MKKRIIIEHISGVEGGCLAIEDTRVAGPKPWGGGKIIKSWKADAKGILDAIGATKEFDSLRASAAEKDAEIERQAARIAEMEDVILRAKESLGYLKSDNFKEPNGTADKQAWTAFSTLEDALLSTPTGAKERIEKAVWEEAAEIASNHECGGEDDFICQGQNCATILAGTFRKRAEGRE